MNEGTRRGDRGQTTLDFAVGITVFLITTAFVFTFIPGMLDPFTGGLEEETVAANRVADSLVLGTLGDPDEPYVLDRECTIAFFDPENNDGSSPSNWVGDCNYAQTEDLYERLGIVGREGPSMNVRIRLIRDLTTGEADSPDHDTDNLNNGDPDDDDPDTLCLDENDDRIIEASGADSGDECDPSSGDGDVLFELGGNPPTETGSVVVARRVVYFPEKFADGTGDATLVVEVW